MFHNCAQLATENARILDPHNEIVTFQNQNENARRQALIENTRNYYDGLFDFTRGFVLRGWNRHCCSNLYVDYAPTIARHCVEALIIINSISIRLRSRSIESVRRRTCTYGHQLRLHASRE